MSDQSHRSRVFAEVQKAILDGELKPGAPLSEREYGKRANVSRIPVREALIQLEGKGLVTMIPDRGAFVRAFGIDEIRELYEVREGLEGVATRLATDRMEAAKIAWFVKQFRGFLEAPDRCDRNAIHRVNVQFHEAIITSCDNALLQRMLGDIRDQCALARVWRFSQSTMPAILERVEHHLAVAEAMAAGDGARAEERMRSHIASWRS